MKDQKLYSPAFLIGNGINYHKNNESFSWETLLLELFPEEEKRKINLKKKKPEVSKYMEILQEIIEKQNNSIPNEKLEDFKSFLDKIVDENKSFSSVLKGLSYSEIAEYAFLLKQNEAEINNESYRINDLKSDIAKIIEKKEDKFINTKHKMLLQFALENNIPILTTNYDKALLKAAPQLGLLPEGRSKVKWLHTQTNKNYDQTFMNNAYFRKEPFPQNDNLNICKEFAIWFIHGTIVSKSYYNSIRITNKDYAESITNIKKLIKQIRTENKETWNNIWMNILMHNDLIIAGLGLGTSEIDLRWLLVERHIYHKYLKQQDNNFVPPKTVYIHSKEIDYGMKQFFENLGVQFLYKSYNEVFNFENYIKKEKDIFEIH